MSLPRQHNQQEKSLLLEISQEEPGIPQPGEEKEHASLAMLTAQTATFMNLISNLNKILDDLGDKINRLDPLKFKTNLSLEQLILISEGEHNLKTLTEIRNFYLNKTGRVHLEIRDYLFQLQQLEKNYQVFLTISKYGNDNRLELMERHKKINNTINDLKSKFPPSEYLQVQSWFCSLLEDILHNINAIQANSKSFNLQKNKDSIEGQVEEKKQEEYHNPSVQFFNKSNQAKQVQNQSISVANSENENSSSRDGDLENLKSGLHHRVANQAISLFGKRKPGPAMMIDFGMADLSVPKYSRHRTVT